MSATRFCLAALCQLMLFTGLPGALAGDEGAGVRRLSLNQAIAIAQAASLDLRTLAIKRQSASRAQGDGLRTFLPKVSLDYANGATIAVNAGDSRSAKLGLTLNQLVFDGNRQGRQQDLAALGVRQAAQARNIAASALAGEVASLTRGIEVLRRKLAIQAEASALARQQALIALKEFELGSGLELDLRDAELAVNGLESQRTQVMIELADSRYRLNQLLGMPAAAQVQVDSDFDPEFRGLALPASWPELEVLARRRSDGLAKGELEIRKRRVELEDASIWFVPNINLEASLSCSGERFPLKDPHFSARLVFDFPVRSFPVKQSVAIGCQPGLSNESALSGSIGILDDLSGFSAQADARAALEIARESLARAGQDVEWRIGQQLLVHGLKLRQLELGRATITTAERRNRILAARLEMGELRRVDYLEAETKLAQSRMDLIQAVCEVQELEQAIEQAAGLERGALSRLAGAGS